MLQTPLVSFQKNSSITRQGHAFDGRDDGRYEGICYSSGNKYTSFFQLSQYVIQTFSKRECSPQIKKTGLRSYPTGRQLITYHQHQDGLDRKSVV